MELLYTVSGATTFEEDLCLEEWSNENDKRGRMKGLDYQSKAPWIVSANAMVIR